MSKITEAMPRVIE